VHVRFSPKRTSAERLIMSVNDPRATRISYLERTNKGLSYDTIFVMPIFSNNLCAWKNHVHARNRRTDGLEKISEPYSC
jgi:hypothetical protein